MKPTKPAKLHPRDKHFRPEKDKDNKFFFPEEFVFRFDKEIIPNIPANLDADFGRFPAVLGHPFYHAAPESKSYHFDRYARLLMDRIRDYNRALYRLRRAHVYYDHPDNFKHMTELDYEAASLKLPEDPSKDPDPKAAFEAIEKEFENACDRLDGILIPTDDKVEDKVTNLPLFFRGNVDCIRINDYIVSIRIGGNASKSPFSEGEKPGRGAQLLVEPHFSSSSHTSVSSGFSSYSSNPNWQAGP